MVIPPVVMNAHLFIFIHMYKVVVGAFFGQALLVKVLYSY